MIPIRPMNRKDPIPDKSLLVTIPYTAIAPNIPAVMTKVPPIDAPV